MTRDFKEELQKKFDAGKKEHNQEWSVVGVDVDTELQAELLDIYNYASLKRDFYQKLMDVAETTWAILEE